MHNIKRFFRIEDVFKDAAKKIVSLLSDRDDFEAKYLNELPCQFCGKEAAGGLFYRIYNQKDWLPAGETINCSACRDKEAFKVYQTKTFENLKSLVDERLAKEYFLVSESLKNVGFSNYEETNDITAGAKEKAIRYTRTFLESFGKCHNLLLMGNPGTGKTHLCTAISRNIKEKGFNVGFLTTGKVLSMIKETYQKGAPKTEAGILRDLKKLDLLILDDIGSEAKGGNDDWRKGMIFEIIECRSGKPTVYTSNLTDEDLPATVGKRVFSRLYDNTKFIDLFTEDYRKKRQIK